MPFARLPDKAIVDNSLSFNSGSKTFNMAGMKNAYWHSTDPTLLSRVQHFHFGAVSTLGCVASEAAYREGGDWLDQLLAYLDDNHKFAEDYIAKNMPSVGYNRPEGTYLTWLDFSETMDKIGAAEMAEKKEMRDAEVYFPGLAGHEFRRLPEPGFELRSGWPGPDALQCRLIAQSRQGSAGPHGRSRQRRLIDILTNRPARYLFGAPGFFVSEIRDIAIHGATRILRNLSDRSMLGSDRGSPRRAPMSLVGDING